MSITIERITEIPGCEACHEVAGRVWGEDSACPIPQMLVHALYGGVVLLARDNGMPVGFVFSFPALYKGKWVLWSHETAVLPEYLHKGIGTKLKMEQWRIAAKMPFHAIAWTFDPLISRNAHFNLNKLHARISEYKVNAYGIMDDLINGSLETDRFIAVWPFLNEGEVQNNVEVKSDPFVMLDVDGRDREQRFLSPRLCELGDSKTQQVVETRIPLDMETVFRESMGVASAWRSAFREAAVTLYGNGYQVAGFERSEKYGVYVWQCTD